MTSPEQQPTSEPGKSEIDIAAARKYLDEAYGPEKATITIDKSIPISEKSETKKTEEPAVPETKVNSITPGAEKKPEVNPLEAHSINTEEIRREENKIVSEAIEEQPAADDSAEIKEKTQQERKEKALEFLSDPKVIEQSPKEIIESFRNLTENENGEHRHLAQEKNELAYKNLRERGCTILIGKEAIKTAKELALKKEQERVKNEEHSRAIATFWERNPNVKEENREKYLGDIKKRLGLDGADGDIAFDHLVNGGYLVEKPKMGWLSWFVGKEIPKIGGKVSLTFENKKDLLQQMAKEATDKISAQARIRTELKFIAGRNRIMAEKQICAKKIIEETVEQYKKQPEKQEKEEKTAPEQTEYVRLGDLLKEVHSLRGDIKNILPRRLLETIQRNQEKIHSFTNDLSIKQWNKVMEAKEAAKKLIIEWIEKTTKKPKK